MSQSLKENILRLRKENKTYNEIAEILDCSKATIHYHCKKENLNNNSKLSDDLVASIKELSNNKTIKEIAEELKISESTVKRYKNKKIEKKTNSQSVIEWRKRVKQRLVEYKGGECVICSYRKCIEVLQFHHLDPNEKDFTISGKSWSFEKLKKEVDKCVLLCANCHLEIHNGWVALEAEKSGLLIQ